MKSGLYLKLSVNGIKKNKKYAPLLPMSCNLLIQIAIDGTMIDK